jgi:hypothetical protein
MYSDQTARATQHTFSVFLHIHHWTFLLSFDALKETYILRVLMPLGVYLVNSTYMNLTLLKCHFTKANGEMKVELHEFVSELDYNVG